jgi:hypothetical protein
MGVLGGIGQLAGAGIARGSKAGRTDAQLYRQQADKVMSGAGLGPTMGERQQQAAQAGAGAERQRQAQTAAMSSMLRGGQVGMGKALQAQGGIAQGAAGVTSQAMMQANLEGQRLAGERLRDFRSGSRQRALQQQQQGQKLGRVAGDTLEQGITQLPGADTSGAFRSWVSGG